MNRFMNLTPVFPSWVLCFAAFVLYLLAFNIIIALIERVDAKKDCSNLTRATESHLSSLSQHNSVLSLLNKGKDSIAWQQISKKASQSACIGI